MLLSSHPFVAKLSFHICLYDMEYAELFSKQYRQCVDRNDFDMYINI